MKPHALDQLLQHPGLWRAADRQSPGQATGTAGLSTGYATLDRELPDGGWPCHDLMEVLCCQWGSGELPLLQPALATLTIFTFMGAWRSFLWPLVVTSTPEMQTLPVMLQAFMGVTGTQWNLLMAGTLLFLGPMIVVFVGGQRFFIKGIQLGAIKG